jgi:hypothetical protein
MKTVIITGGRDYDDWAMLQEVLNFIDPDLVVQGGASGADKMALQWAEYNKKELLTFNADWDKHGRAAGPIRNREMLKAHPEGVVVAFPGGKGTADCVRAAFERNMVILQVHK